MKFEYDSKKSRMNKEKHGIDFVEAQNLWKDQSALIIPANTTDDELRYALISFFNKKCFALFSQFEKIHFVLSA